MKNVFEKCNMWGVVNGSETIPSDDTANTAKHRIWIKKNNLAKAMITQYIKANLVIKVAHAKRTKESWDIFLSEFSQNQLRVDNALVPTSHQATPLQQQCLHSRHGLSGSYPLPCKCRIQHSWLHCSSHSSFHTSIRSRGSSILEPTCCWHQNRQRHH